MKQLSKEKAKVLAENNGWSLVQAEGYVDGEIFRRRGKTPSTYAQIGIDEYCRGFRAGYYERQSVTPTASLPRLPLTRVSLRGFGESAERIDATPVPAPGG